VWRSHSGECKENTNANNHPEDLSGLDTNVLAVGNAVKENWEAGFARYTLVPLTTTGEGSFARAYEGN